VIHRCVRGAIAMLVVWQRVWLHKYRMSLHAGKGQLGKAITCAALLIPAFNILCRGPRFTAIIKTKYFTMVIRFYALAGSMATVVWWWAGMWAAARMRPGSRRQQQQTSRRDSGGYTDALLASCCDWCAFNTSELI
jgi:hypothetical protein